MKYTELGKTGLHVSEIGFGAWAIGGQKMMHMECLCMGQTLPGMKVQSVRN